MASAANIILGPNRFGIQNVPAMLFFKGGELKEQVVGLSSRADLIYRLGALK